ncbi:MAG: M61 family metallopeptidase [Flavobacteriia bacterium]|nr:M61 family metallopeptidase [Flavobacteriia bacterium]
MINYHFNIENPSNQYIQIQLLFETKEKKIQIQLPSWRPGRYELGNFAKNIRNFKVIGDEHKLLRFNKISKDCWEIENNDCQKIKIDYQYYASELNAGSTYLDENQLYVNPVNCCVYIVGRENEEISLQINAPSSFKIACALPIKNSSFYAKNYDVLADSPFICSPTLQYNKYIIKNHTFHLWFQGEINLNWEILLNDFEAFTSKQIEKFIEFPVENYHFFFQIVPYPAYHGVEHQSSTVILLGPSFELFKNLYSELLGVSSHELYHTWNVKSIRPIEMYPYNFTKENYSRMGYLYEGVTTYMGDLFLYKSGVFDLNQYLIELGSQVQKHLDNFARFTYSVRESSFDTWLDGYVPGAPFRKVSIYTEGCLLAFFTDVFIISKTNGKHSLDEVMKRLYFDFYLNEKGVSEEDYIKAIENISGASFQELFKAFFVENQPFESILIESLQLIGLDLKHKPSSKYISSKLGLKCVPSSDNQGVIIKSIYPGSPAEMASLMQEDEIIAVNSYLSQNDPDKWLNYFDNQEKVITIKRKGKLLQITLPESVRNYYLEYEIVELREKNHIQQKYFEKWKS